jgi:AcrR family transcriptional regulator
MTVDPTPGRSRRQQRKEQTREQLVEAAGRVFARKGFHETTMADVAEEAGYSTGAIYVHFAGKDELFLEVAASYVATRARENQGVRDEAGGNLPKRAKALGDHWMARVAADPSYMFLSFEFLGYARNKPELRAQLAPRTAAGRDQIARMIAAAAERDDIDLPMSAEDLGIVMRELGGGLAMAKLIDPDAFRDELFGEFLEAFFSLLPARTAPAGGKARKG